METGHERRSRDTRFDLSDSLVGEPGLQLSRPNPFRDATEILFVLPTKTHVRLEIYNVAGRHVALLADEAMVAGPHAIRWNAANQPSGLCFCRLTTEGIAELKAMVLIR